MTVMSAADRWDSHVDKASTTPPGMDYALMSDLKTLVIFDAEPDGYFFIKTDANGTIYAELRSGERSEIYCEPIWLCGWTDIYLERT